MVAEASSPELLDGVQDIIIDQDRLLLNAIRMPNLRPILPAIILAAVLFIGLAGHAHAQEFTAATNMVPPLKYIQNGKLKGVISEILQELLKRTGNSLSPEIKTGPLTQSYAMVRDTPDMLLPGLAITPQRKPEFKWVGPIYTSRFGLIGKKSKQLSISTIADAKQYSITSVAQSAPEKLLLQAGYPAEQVVSSPGTEDAVRLLEEDKVDMLCFAISPAFHVMLLSGIDPHKYEILLELKTMDLYIAFNKETDDAIINALQSALEEIRHPGPDGVSVYETIVRKYFTPDI